METRVEHSHCGNALTQLGSTCPDHRRGSSIVQRCKDLLFFNGLDHIVVNPHGLPVTLAAVNDALAHNLHISGCRNSVGAELARFHAVKN